MLARRMLAIMYDTILLFAVLMLATALYMLLLRRAQIAADDVGFSVYLWLIAYGYFASQWRAGGQTLGMRCWRLRLTSTAGALPSWRACALRFAVAIVSWAALGLGFAWVLLDRHGRAWHDLASATQLSLQADPRDVR